MTLEAQLAENGLYLHGIAALNAEEIETCSLPAEYASVALVGNRGSSYWSAFSQAPEFADGRPDPLDRWSKRVAARIAAEHAVHPVFPSDGPPYLPFQRWAQRAEGLSASPLGILIHPDRGLWHSYRFALLCQLQPGETNRRSPCVDCRSKPCLTSCPVDAISERGYDTRRCADYLVDNPDSTCLKQGCQARYACPVAPKYRYRAEQSRFHLQAFLDARHGP